MLEFVATVNVASPISRRYVSLTNDPFYYSPKNNFPPPFKASLVCNKLALLTNWSIELGTSASKL